MSFIHDNGSAIVMKPRTAMQSMAIQDSTFGQVKTQVGRFEANYQLSPQQKAVLQRLEPFYTDEMIDELLRPIVNQTGVISLRALDWLCTNWSKSKNIICRDLNGKQYNIHHGYKMALTYFRR